MHIVVPPTSTSPPLHPIMPLLCFPSCYVWDDSSWQRRVICDACDQKEQICLLPLHCCPLLAYPDSLWWSAHLLYLNPQSYHSVI